MACGDFDGDQRRDLAITNSPSNSAGQGQDGLTILLARDGFRRVRETPVPTGAAPTQLAAGDLDGDGRDDVAVSNMNSDTLSIARLAADGRLVVTETIRAGRAPKGISIGDLNGDGKPDLVVANNGDDDIAIVLAR